MGHVWNFHNRRRLMTAVAPKQVIQSLPQPVSGIFPLPDHQCVRVTRHHILLYSWSNEFVYKFLTLSLEIQISVVYIYITLYHVIKVEMALLKPLMLLKEIISKETNLFRFVNIFQEKGRRIRHVEIRTAIGVVGCIKIIIWKLWIRIFGRSLFWSGLKNYIWNQFITFSAISFDFGFLKPTRTFY